MKDKEKTIGKMIDKQKICYISSIDSDGFPNTKAMLRPRKRNGITEIYFSTNTSSLKVQSFRKNPKACLYFCNKRFFRGLMIKGTIEVLEDQASKDMLWERGDTLYYKKGVTDPDYCVLKFTSISARYYSNFKSEDITISSEKEE
ncbi:MAG: pyridoxamine 5'-phosphate oxidase family protein [Bacilli bacterium]|nr:pyridoxamine 5'-phosphate oxidase family protein [Bacilli bacterium]